MQGKGDIVLEFPEEEALLIPLEPCERSGWVGSSIELGGDRLMEGVAEVIILFWFEEGVIVCQKKLKKSKNILQFFNYIIFY